MLEELTPSNSQSHGSGLDSGHIDFTFMIIVLPSKHCLPMRVFALGCLHSGINLAFLGYIYKSQGMDLSLYNGRRYKNQSPVCINFWQSLVLVLISAFPGCFLYVYLCVNNHLNLYLFYHFS